MIPGKTALAGSLLLLLVAACGDPDPIRIGFIGGLTGRSADIGEASRNAVQLAVEQVNEAGGIDGRQIEMLVRDDANDPAQAEAAVRDLHGEGVVAIIGPNISAVAGGMLPAIDELSMVTVSPTVSSLDFAARDDFFFRINLTTRDNARYYAKHYFAKGFRRIAVAIDANNRVFSESWLREFIYEFEASDGKVVTSETFDATQQDSYAETAAALLAQDVDAILLVANSVDTAQLVQQLRKFNSTIPLIAAEWAASERLIALGGKAIEGLELVQSYNRADTSEHYLAFRRAYKDHFQADPDYASVAAYDAATVLFAALKASEDYDAESLKAALLDLQDVQGLQQSIEFDRFGDAQRRAFFVVVRDGLFELQ